MIRRLLPYALASLMFIMMGCGDATEVGNPTGEIPTTRTIKGVLDTTTLETLADATADTAQGADYDIDVTALTVSAIGYDGTLIDGPVNDAGEFAFEITVGTAYSLEVMQGGTAIGYFTFEQDAEGTEANYLRFDLPGDVVDFGEVRYRQGAFRPDQQPRFRQGFHPYPGPPPLDGSQPHPGGYDPSSGYQYGDGGPTP